MREIKFRAYDLKKKIIFPVHKIDFNKINQSIEFIQGYDNWDKDGYTVYGGGNMKYANKDRYILMQYTGLKDKNGKEIYEGDILRNDDEEIAIVQYSEEDAMFEIIIDNISTNFSNESSKWWEVIGNIYENKDLLKKEGKEDE